MLFSYSIGILDRFAIDRFKSS